MKAATSQTEQQRVILQGEISRRMRRNPKFSLRSFARSSGVSHTVLSLFLTGKRSLSKKASQKLVTYLDLDPVQQGNFVAAADSNMDTGFPLSMDQFEHISNWHGLAILSLLELPEALFEASWIAHRLAIRELEARDSMERLVRLKLVEKAANGKWRQAVTPIRFDKRGATAAARNYNQQLLERAALSLEEDPAEVRDFSSITFAFDPSELVLAREEILKFRRKLCAKLETKGKPREVYSLSIQLFPVTRPNKTHSTGKKEN
jgi:transcriptional regulator with XRE-family HTH domain